MMIEHVLGSKSPNKRLSQKKRRPTVNHVLASSSSSSGMKKSCDSRVALDCSEEVMMMSMAEEEQTLVDRFWGKDKEDTDRCHEITLFSNEEHHSTAYEESCKTYQRWQHWEQLYKEIKLRKAYDDAINEHNERRVYLTSLLTSKTSDEVMGYKWGTKPHVNPPPIAESANGYGMMNVNNINSMCSLTESSMAMSTFVLPEHVDGIKTSVHMDGMQQALAIIDDPTSNPGLLGQTVRSRTANGLVEKAMTEQRMRGSDNRPVTKGGGIGMNIPSSAKKFLASVVGGNEKEITSKLLTPPLLRHVEEVDGHPVYKWDQCTILKTAYSKMIGGRGDMLTVSSLISSITNNKTVIDLLRFTVYGPWIKKKRWVEFLMKFGSRRESSNQEERGTRGGGTSTSNTNVLSDYNALATITLADWLGGAADMCTERRVSRRLIRSEAKHRRSYMGDGNGDGLGGDSWVQLLEKVKPGWFAERSREYTSWDLEEAYLSRQVAIGDVVYALAGKGAVWLPAIIERVNKRDLNGASVLSYDLKYVYHYHEIVDARGESANRRLLALNNKLERRERMMGQGGDRDREGLEEMSYQPIDPLPIHEEKFILERTYDIIDVDKKGTLTASLLFNALKSEAMDMVVRSTVSLRLLVGKREEEGKGKYPFKQAYSDIFEGDPSDDDSMSGMITKQEFVDFCLYAADINTFNS